MLAAFKKAFRPAPEREDAQRVYMHAVDAARAPRLYSEYGIPDTLDGRFDAIILHLFLLIERLKHEAMVPEKARELSRNLTEAFFSDMDRSLREMGVSDTGVGKRVKRMASAFYGRIEAYTQGLSSEEALNEALTRNIYPNTPATPEQVAALGAYLRCNLEVLHRQSLETIRENLLFT